MMLSQMNCKIWLARHRVDFRKQHEGLLAEAYRINLNPYKGDVIIFIGKNLRKIKVLYADNNGIWLSSKLFSSEAMKTKFKFLNDPFCDEISSAELALIIDGTRYSIEKKVSPYIPN
ncbi:MAG: IS66 family insertion sequence element accessory protein TnpB [Candidatus Magasanikbacteria bacterium]|nr:IS66 family insertion sequence element accessory protein TnpB [Candidatus Magasanikbacteria bacterium]